MAQRAKTTLLQIHVVLYCWRSTRRHVPQLVSAAAVDKLQLTSLDGYRLSTLPNCCFAL